MIDARLILKGVFSFFIIVWTMGIVINVIRDLLYPDVNYYGVFFAILIAFALILLGDGILIGLYFLFKRFISS